MINFNNEWLDKPYPELTDEQLLAVANVYQQWHDEEGHRSCVYMLALRSQLAAERERAARLVGAIEPVAKVHINRTGGNVGIAWRAIGIDGSLPALADGEVLYVLRTALEGK